MEQMNVIELLLNMPISTLKYPSLNLEIAILIKLISHLLET